MRIASRTGPDLGFLTVEPSLPRSSLTKGLPLDPKGFACQSNTGTPHLSGNFAEIHSISCPDTAVFEMRSPILFDLTCYPGYFFKPTPTGIGRIDMAFGQHFLAQRDRLAAGLRSSRLGPVLSSADAMQAVYDAVSNHWSPLPDDPVGRQVERWLLGQETRTRRITAPTGFIADKLAIAAKLARYWPRRDRSLTIPKDAIYLNISYPMLEHPRCFRWLKSRPDVTAVFMVHDLIAVDYPEYFRRGIEKVFRKEMRTILEFAHLVVVPSEAVRERMVHFAHENGRSDLIVKTLHFPPPPEFEQRAAKDPTLQNVPYFLVCSTIEPRKNHLLLLNVWRDIANAGHDVPKLIVVGKRGWENEQIVDMLERCEAIREHVIEVSGLQTESLRRLLANARALLMPSFAEGYGLPLVEGRSQGTPVVASDIPVFREIAQGYATFLDPTDGPGWREAIQQLAAAPISQSVVGTSEARNWDAYFRDFDAIVDIVVSQRKTG